MKKFIQNHSFQSAFQNADENEPKMFFGKTKFQMYTFKTDVVKRIISKCTCLKCG